MNVSLPPEPGVVIACGGTGGHLFPGIAVAQAMMERGCGVCLLISEKEVDRQAAGTVSGMKIATLPAVGLTRGRRIAFAAGFARSFFRSRALFREFRPGIALAMGGFTSAPPILAARRFGAGVFLHESNSIAGRANRMLSRFVRESFIGLPSAAGTLRGKVTVTGTPVRPEFFGLNAARCRSALGFDPARPVVLVMGGSQGAEGINRMVAQMLPRFSSRPYQWLHLAGAVDGAFLRASYEKAGVSAQVHDFMSRMDLALGAATVAVSRSGASSLAELAAACVPSVLIPFPKAVDNHQYFNAAAYWETGAAMLMEQCRTTTETLAGALERLLSDDSERERMRENLKRWQAPGAAETIAEAMLGSCGYANVPGISGVAAGHRLSVTGGSGRDVVAGMEAGT